MPAKISYKKEMYLVAYETPMINFFAKMLAANSIRKKVLS